MHSNFRKSSYLSTGYVATTNKFTLDRIQVARTAPKKKMIQMKESKP